MPASRRPCTNRCQSAFCTGTGLPLPQTRPGIVSRFAASAIARPLFSIASQPPYAPASGFTDAVGSASFCTDAGSTDCDEKSTFEFGKRMPRITCSSVPWTCCARGAAAAAPARAPRACAMTTSAPSTVAMSDNKRIENIA